jgi:TRAP-type C4-dicarboxylate transport system permease small subunit
MITRITHFIGWLLRGADRAAEALVIALFAVIVLVGGLQVLCRYAINASLSWSEELQRYGLIWIVFLALVIGYRRGAHIGMGLFLEKLPRAVQDRRGLYGSIPSRLFLEKLPRAVQMPMGWCIDFLFC